MGRQGPSAPENPRKSPDRLRESPLQYISRTQGQVAEWLKAHAWKVCNGESRSRVRIPLCPPNPISKFNKFRKLSHHLASRDLYDLEPMISPAPITRQTPA